MLINCEKSKCVHFRRNRTNRTNFTFKIGDNILEIKDHYKYLGVTFQEYNNFYTNCEALSKGAGRALGAIINKIHSLKDFGFRAYEKLFQSCVIPIMDYGSSTWGNKPFQSIDNVQNRALRYFLGVHRFAPTLALHGDTGWIPSLYRHWINILRYWNRLLVMDENRLTRKVFDFDYAQRNNNWSCQVKQIMDKVGLTQNYLEKSCVNLQIAKEKISDYYSRKWSEEINNTPKLRTYRLFKTEFKCENYVLMDIKKNERSLLCQLCCGILPLRIETGRYSGETPEQRLCVFCPSGKTETELHFIFDCAQYSDIRISTLGDKLNTDTFRNLSEQQQLANLLTLHPRQTAKYIVKSYLRRRKTLYSR